MYTLRCSALGVGNCEFEATGDSIESAMLAGKAHIQATHFDVMHVMKHTMTSDEIDSRLESVVREL